MRWVWAGGRKLDTRKNLRLFPGPIVGNFAVFIRFWTHLSRGAPSLLKEQAIEIVG